MKETISVDKAIGAIQKLQVNQQTGEKPDILKAKGDIGIDIYFIKYGLRKTFQPHFERFEDLNKERGQLAQEYQELKKEFNELKKKEKENKTGLSSKDSKRKGEIEKRFEEINTRIDEINDDILEELKIEKDVSIEIDKIPLKDIKNLVDVDILESLDWAIDFSKREE